MQKNVITFLCSLLASEIINSIDMRITCFKVFSELQGPFCSLFIKLSRQFASNVNIVVIDYLPPHDFNGNSRRASGDPFILDALSLAGEFSFHSPPFISRALPNSCTLTSLTMYNPKVLIVALLFSLSLILAAKSAEQLQIGVKYVPEECPIKSRKGDRLSMQ